MNKKMDRVLLTSAGDVSTSVLLSLKKTIEKSYGDGTLCVVEQGVKCIASIESDSEPIICVCSSDESLQNWLWGDFRNKENVLNPVLILGYEPLENISSGEKLFNHFWNRQQHRYITLPWPIEEVLSSLNQLEPLEADTEREALVKNFSYNAELEKILTHTFHKDDIELLKEGLAKGMEIAETRANDFLIQQFKQCKVHIDSMQLAELSDIAEQTWKTIKSG